MDAELKKGTVGLTVPFIFVQTSASLEFSETEKGFRPSETELIPSAAAEAAAARTFRPGLGLIDRHVTALEVPAVQA